MVLLAVVPLAVVLLAAAPLEAVLLEVVPLEAVPLEAVPLAVVLLEVVPLEMVLQAAVPQARARTRSLCTVPHPLVSLLLPDLNESLEEDNDTNMSQTAASPTYVKSAASRSGASVAVGCILGFTMALMAAYQS